MVIRKNCLVPPLSSMISTRPGFNCSMDGTWLARIPISPDSAGTLTWTLGVVSYVCLYMYVCRAKSQHIGMKNVGMGGLKENIHVGRLVKVLNREISVSIKKKYSTKVKNFGSCPSDKAG